MYFFHTPHSCYFFVLMYTTGNTCEENPIMLQGVIDIPIITDAECTSRWGTSFDSTVMICVFNSENGACDVISFAVIWVFFNKSIFS